MPGMSPSPITCIVSLSVLPVKLEADAGPSRLACLLPPVATHQSLSPVANDVEGVVPGAARLVSETAQRVHAIGQSQKNDQHLLRVQALLSGRKAKGLTSGRSWTLLLRPHYLFLLASLPLQSQHIGLARRLSG